MIHWSLVVGALFGGAGVGFLLMALLTAGASEYSWRQGYNEGREEGFQAGAKDALTKES